MPKRRARTPFDWQALKVALASNPSTADFTQYLAFYGYAEPVGHKVAVLPVTLADRTETVVLQCFAPEHPKGWALLHPGYYDHVGLFAHTVDYLLERQVGVYAFDQLGHGLSSGPRVTIETFDDYIAALDTVVEHLAQEVGPTWHWLGQSMGGAIVMEFLHRHPERATGELVLYAPLVRPYAWSVNRLYFALAKRLIRTRPRTITRNANNAEFLNLQHNDPLQADILPVAWVQSMVNWFEIFEQYPTSSRAPKIIQGRKDRTVSARHNMKVLGARYPAARWLHLPDASHHLANESDELRAEMHAWLDAECDWVRQ